MTSELARQVDQVDITPEQHERLCEIVAAEPGIGIAHALREAGVAGTKGQLRAYAAEHPDLLDDVAEARSRPIRREIIRRAIDGDEVTIFGKDGEIVGTRIERSDRLLEFAGRMYLPEARALRSGTQQIEVTGKDGGPVEFEDRSASLTDVARVLEAVGALAQLGSPAPRPALPAASEVLAEPAEG